MAYWLVMTTADGSERPFRIQKERTVIGRAARSDVRIPIPTVEQRHCEITYRDDKLELTDLGSARGTLHNGTPVQQQVSLSPRDRLTIGPVTLEVRLDDGRVPLITTEVKPLDGARVARPDESMA
jgi:pSer/pThr/pTyr-binding forkhead associated (FHA) protein